MERDVLDLSLEPDLALPRRERERWRRVRDILAAAQRLVLNEGFGSFSMQRLAEETEYSPAALYKYFASKEDVLTTLALESHRRRIALFERIDRFDARPRERMVARGEAVAILYPEFFNIELLHFAECIRDRVSPGPRDQMRELTRVEHETSLRIVQDAVACGDLELPSAITPEEVVYTMFMLVAGVLGSLGVAVPTAELGINDVVRVMRRSGSVTLDGYGWRPLSTEWDYRKTMRRVYGELFPELVIHQVRSL
jgi:AcrR family transcriptional regulator